MPVVGRRPAVFLHEGTACLVLSEHSRRDRGVMELYNGGTTFRSLVVLETPLRGERLLWYGQAIGANFDPEGALFPVLVLEKNARSGALPLTARYLRHALNPEVVFDPKTNLVHVVWTWNSYTPLRSPDRYIACARQRLIPISTQSVGGSETWPSTNVSPDLALSKDPSQVANNQVLGKVADSVYADGVLARFGKLSLMMGPPPNQPIPTGMRWLGATIKLVVCRRPFPDTSLHTSPVGHTPTDLTLVSLPLEYQAPYAGFVSVKDSHYRMTVQATLRLNGREVGKFIWDLQQDTLLTLEADDTRSAFTPQQVTGTLYLAEPQDGPPSSIQLDLETTVDPLADPSDEVGAVYYRAAEVVLECTNPTNQLLNQYYGDPNTIPIPFTEPLPDKEPHAQWRQTVDPQYSGQVGDPPLETAGGFPGIFNNHALSEQMLVGGTSQARLYNPFQTTDVHQRLPGSPGLIDPQIVNDKALDINLQSIPDNLEDHTGHLYGEQEVQNLRLSTRTLMYSVGTVTKFIVREKVPPTGSTTASESATGLRIGISSLEPGIPNVKYQDSDTNYSQADASGAGGHKFQASGGSAPYTWTIRRTRSSESKPAISRDLESSDYPYDLRGFPVSGVDFPAEVMNGGMPDGMYFTSEGVLYGVPTESGTFLFRIVCRDQIGTIAEQTVRLYVIGGSDDVTIWFPGDSPRKVDPTNQTRMNGQLSYQVQIAKATLPDLRTFQSGVGWTPLLRAVGGQAPYRWRFTYPNDSPRQKIPTSFSGNAVILSDDGTLTLNIPFQSAFDDMAGLWIWEVEAKESYPGTPTLSRVPLTLAIGTTSISHFDDPLSPPPPPSPPPAFIPSSIPEGEYGSSDQERYVLILEPPIAIEHYPESQNVTLRGTRGTYTQPGMGEADGPYMGPGPVNTTNPGVMTPVGLVGVNTLGYNPAKFQLDYIISNSTGLWNQVDRFDPDQLANNGQVTTSPPPPGPPSPPPVVIGETIDDQTPIGKRVRPLWPV